MSDDDEMIPAQPYETRETVARRGRFRSWWYEFCAVAAIREGWRSRIYTPPTSASEGQ